MHNGLVLINTNENVGFKRKFKFKSWKSMIIKHYPCIIVISKYYSEIGTTVSDGLKFAQDYH